MKKGSKGAPRRRHITRGEYRLARINRRKQRAVAAETEILLLAFFAVALFAFLFAMAWRAFG